MVFHSPQLSQRPDHFEKDDPQEVQVKESDFAMDGVMPDAGQGSKFD